MNAMVSVLPDELQVMLVCVTRQAVKKKMMDLKGPGTKSFNMGKEGKKDGERGLTL